MSQHTERAPHAKARPGRAPMHAITPAIAIAMVCAIASLTTGSNPTPP